MQLEWTTITLYDAHTWRARVVVDLQSSFGEWAFESNPTTLLVRVPAGALKTQVLAIDLASGESKVQVDGPPSTALARPMRTAKLGERSATADLNQVFIANVRTGDLEIVLGVSPNIPVKAIRAGDTIEVVALWPTGELAAFDLVASKPALFEPPLAEQRVARFAADDQGRLILARRDGDVWQYDRDKAGVHRGRVVLRRAHPTSLAIDGASGRWFAGFNDGRVRGFDAKSGNVMFSSSTNAGRVAELELWDGQLRAWSARGTSWTFDPSSSRLVDIASEGMVSLLGGDPDVEPQPAGEEAKPKLVCAGSRCSVSWGMFSVRIAPGWSSGSFVLTDGFQFELLGSPRQDAVRCLAGSLVVEAEQCEAATRGVGLVGQTRAAAAARTTVVAVAE